MSDQPLSRYELFLIQLAGQAVNIKYVYLSVVVFLVYHCLINLDDEIKYIWGMKWGFSKCFYIATKYLAFCDGIMALVYLFNTNLQPSTCAVLYPAIIYFVAFGALVAEIIISMRTWIAWGFSRYILWYLTLVVVATTSIILFLVQAHSVGRSPWPTHGRSPIPTIMNCFPMGQNSALFGGKQYLNFVCVIVLELNVLLLTLWNLKRNSLWWRNRDTNSLIYVFHRDALVYLVSLLGISVVNVGLFKYQKNTLYEMLMLEPQRIAHGVLSAQLILNARKYAESLVVDASGEWGSHPLDTLSMTFQAMAATQGGIEGCEEEIELREK